MKTLIAITTCNRLKYVKRYIWDYLAFCNKNENYDFLLALDGFSKDYMGFTERFQIPLLYSDVREGVGLSKNRVLNKFPDYDYYFFVEDDVELLNPDFFDLHIKLCKKTGYSHLNSTKVRKMSKTTVLDESKLIYGKYGGAVITFYKGKELKQIGGWHDLFAKYKRYGHTEQTYRFYNTGLIPEPFIVIENARKMRIVHNPPHVSSDLGKVNNETHLFHEEQTLMDKKLKHYPFITLSEFYFNGFPMSFNKTVDEFLKKNKRKYPLTNGKERRIALAEHYFLRIKTTSNIFKKALYLLLSLLNYPFNTPLKHFIKTKISRLGK